MEMKQEHNNYIIYKAQNTINNQVYIGATTNSLEQRAQDHIERANRGEEGKFQQAISTFSAGAFEWEQIDTADSVDELALKEKKYIYEFNAKENGYNSDEGGGFKKTVYQYNLDNGSLVQAYSSLTDAGDAINATKQSISRACLSVNNVYQGFYWSYEYNEPFEPNEDARKKEVLQFNLDGEILNNFNSVADASKQTGLSKTCISRVCRGEREQSGGYIWKYS
jgi:hypothetical protein